MNLPLSAIHFAGLYVTLHFHRRSQRRFSDYFIEYADARQDTLDVGAWFMADALTGRLANLQRRADRPLFSDWKTAMWNKFHIDQRKCKCCHQVIHGYRELIEGVVLTKSVYTFPENCPLCDWYWAL